MERGGERVVRTLSRLELADRWCSALGEAWRCREEEEATESCRLGEGERRRGGGERRSRTGARRGDRRLRKGEG